MGLSSKYLRLKSVFIFVLIVFCVGCVISVLLIPGDFSENTEICRCMKTNHHLKLVPEHTLGVIIPFRDRFDELLDFVPHMSSFLTNQSIYFKIFIINQVDDHRFNRASLINVGFKEALSNGCDYFVMHDVDLLPLTQELSYQYPSSGIFHIASPDLHPRYHYKTFVGGILLMKKEDFIKVNGMSNKYWGWGMEDDEFYVRVVSAGIHIYRPNITATKENAFRHNHNKRRKRDFVKCFNQKNVTRRRDYETGLSNVDYNVVSRKNITVENFSAVIINTELHCNKSVTPWCLCDDYKTPLYNL